MDDKGNKSNPDSNESFQGWLEKFLVNRLVESTGKFVCMVDLAVKKGAINSESREMINGVLKVADSQVRDIMIDRRCMATIHVGMKAEDILSFITSTSHTRFPVFNRNGTEICGILHTKDLLKIIVKGKKIGTDSIYSILRPALFIPESKNLDSLLKEFKSSHNRLAIIVDEYGCVSGLITIEDIIEEIIGNICDEFDKKKTQIIELEPNAYSVNALTEIEDFNQFFKCHIDNSEADTIGGIIINRLKNLPNIGDQITFHGFNFKVAEADQRSIQTLHVRYEG
jgi:magnesium and cobalt transporter